MTVTGAEERVCVFWSWMVCLRLKGSLVNITVVVAVVLGSNSGQDDSTSEDQWLVGAAAELPSRRILDADHGKDH